MFVSSALIGFGQGYQPVCAFNYGAGKKDRVREGYFFCVKYGTAFLITMSALCLLFAPHIIRFFRNDPDVIAVGTVALRWQASALPLQAIVVITNMMLQSMGKGVPSMILSLSRSGIVYIPMLLIMSALFAYHGTIWAQPVADVIAVVLAILMYKNSMKKDKEMQ